MRFRFRMARGQGWRSECSLGVRAIALATQRIQQEFQRVTGQLPCSAKKHDLIRVCWRTFAMPVYAISHGLLPYQIIALPD
jgi:hypothetical protein